MSILHVHTGIVVSICIGLFGCFHFCSLSVCLCSSSAKCNEYLWRDCVLIARDRYHQIWHHGQINESAVFRYSPVSLSDLLPESRSTQEKKRIYLFILLISILYFLQFYIQLPQGKTVCLYFSVHFQRDWSLAGQPLKKYIFRQN